VVVLAGARKHLCCLSFVRRGYLAQEGHQVPLKLRIFSGFICWPFFYFEQKRPPEEMVDST
jgi:hypothetical protein